MRHTSEHEGERIRTARVSAKTREARAAERLERLADRLNDKVGRVSEKVARHEQAVARAQEQLDRATEQIGALAVWTRKSPTPRKPRFTREELAATAIEIADAEGFDAVSMRRIAAELQSGTMTLYHYVETKDELFSLVVDAVMGELLVPEDEPFPTDWRVALTTIAHRSRDALVRHPWMFDIVDDPPLGPNSVRHFDQSMQAVASLDISLHDQLDIVGAVDAYVFGFCLHERNNTQDGGDPFDRGMIQYVNELIATGEYPQLAAMTAAHGLEETWAEMGRFFRDPERFDRGLARMLDGFAAALHLPR
jgi:AcrR family transcriptional regulator